MSIYWGIDILTGEERELYVVFYSSLGTSPRTIIPMSKERKDLRLRS